jgi:hypothetical protein
VAAAWKAQEAEQAAAAAAEAAALVALDAGRGVFSNDSALCTPLVTTRT